MKKVTNNFETLDGFSSMTDDEVFLVNAGGFKEGIAAVGEVIIQMGEGVKNFLTNLGGAFIEVGVGMPTPIDLTTKNPNHSYNQHDKPKC